MGSGGAEERRSGGAEEQRSRGAEEEERTDNFWIQSSRNPTQNFVHPSPGYRLGGFCIKIVAKCDKGNPKPAPTAINLIWPRSSIATLPSSMLHIG
ncbi:MAG: hypothetical protein F6K41_01830 [Symploca sp. SIO3E6]|nr:hypothetical protein [Caldora sp. SIO3E6]